MQAFNMNTTNESQSVRELREAFNQAPPTNSLAWNALTRRKAEAVIAELEAVRNQSDALRLAILRHKEFVDAVNPSPCKGDLDLHAILDSTDCGRGYVKASGLMVPWSEVSETLKFLGLTTKSERYKRLEALTKST